MTNKGQERLLSGRTNKTEERLQSDCGFGPAQVSESRPGAPEVVATSAVDGTGIEELRRAILGELRAVPASADTVPVTNLRQHGAVVAALEAVRSAQGGMEQEVPHEMLLLDLHECLEALDGLTGTTHTEEILGLIFSSFCIGK